jgi:hypothetical protein
MGCTDPILTGFYPCQATWDWNLLGTKLSCPGLGPHLGEQAEKRLPAHLGALLNARNSFEGTQALSKAPQGPRSQQPGRGVGMLPVRVE